MHYMGSKARHAAEIIAITTANRRDTQIYVEPFVGGGNVINKVPHGAGRLAGDKNVGMVALLDCLGNRGWAPPDALTKGEWKKVMKLKLEDLDWEGKAWFALCATGVTFGSKWCEGWVNEPQRYNQARNAAMKDAPGLRGIEFHAGGYDTLNVPEGSIVYCDPPYCGTADYAGSKATIKVDECLSQNQWKAAPFWKWCDRLVDEKGCNVFVSEYSGPEPGIYPNKPTPEQFLRLHDARKHCMKLQADRTVSTVLVEDALYAIRTIEDEVREAADALASRWKVVWSKEVVSDFSPSRKQQSDDDENKHMPKKEVECLFHRGT